MTVFWRDAAGFHVFLSPSWEEEDRNWKSWHGEKNRDFMLFYNQAYNTKIPPKKADARIVEA